MIQKFLERWRAELPEFWKKIRSLSITLGTSAVSIMAADKLFELQSYGIPLVVFTICGYIVIACAALGLTAQLTKKSNDNNTNNE